MAKKVIVTAILVSLVLFLQSGCKTKEAEKPKITEQPKTTPTAETVKPVVTPAPAPVKPTPAPVTPAPGPVTPAPAQVAPVPVAPATGGAYVLRVNCGYFSAYTDKAGKVWQPDQDYSDAKKWGAQGGSTIERPGLNVPDTNCPIIYESERYSMDGYKFLVPNGKYKVILHFAETFEGISGAGERVFDVSLNGKPILENFDPFKEAGAFNKPAVKTFNVEVTDGQILIGFKAKVENPQICGIEILSQ